MNFKSFIRCVIIIVSVPFILAFIEYTIEAYRTVYETLFWIIIIGGLSSLPMRDALKVQNNIPKEKLPEIIGRQPLFRRNDMLRLVMPLLIVILVLLMFVIGIVLK